MGYLFNADVKAYVNLNGKPVPVTTKTIYLKLKVGEDVVNNGVIYSDLFTNTETGIHISFVDNTLRVNIQDGTGKIYSVQEKIELDKISNVLIEHDNSNVVNNLKMYVNSTVTSVSTTVPVINKTESSRNGCFGRVRSDITSYQSNDLTIYEFVVWDRIIDNKANIFNTTDDAIHIYKFDNKDTLKDYCSSNTIDGAPYNISMVNLYHYLIKNGDKYYTTNMSSYNIEKDIFKDVQYDIQNAFNDIRELTNNVETFRVEGKPIDIDGSTYVEFELSNNLEIKDI